METIIAALISAAAAITVSVITAKKQHQATIAQLEKQTELLQFRIKSLETKVDKHNSVIERTYALEKKTAVLTEQVKVANHRIEDLEHT